MDLFSIVRDNAFLFIVGGLVWAYFANQSAASPTGKDRDTAPLPPLDNLKPPATIVPTQEEAIEAVNTLARAYRARGWTDEKIREFTSVNLINLIAP